MRAGKMECVVCKCATRGAIQCSRVQQCPNGGPASGAPPQLPPQLPRHPLLNQPPSPPSPSSSPNIGLHYCLPSRCDTLCYSSLDKRGPTAHYQFAFDTHGANASNILVYSWTLKQGLCNRSIDSNHCCCLLSNLLAS